MYVDSFDKFSFFKRFCPPIKECGYEIVILTNRVSLFLFGVIWHVKTNLVRKGEKQTIDYDIGFTREVRDNSLTDEEAMDLYSAIYRAAERVHKIQVIDYVFIFGGSNTAEHAMAQFAREHKIKKLFFELSNIPGKIFVDPIGTNAHSSIYNDISILKQYPADKSEYRLWKKEYLLLKEKESMPPQSAKRRKIYVFYLLDHMGFKLLNVPCEDNRSLFKKVGKKIWQKTTTIEYDRYNLETGNFIFFPMQVSTDAQLLFHSKINNVQAIEIAYEAAKSRDLELLVKPHPAEVDSLEYERVIDLKKKLNFYLVNQPTINILRYCVRVVTINSTVGLEAILLHKPVDFLGKTFYESLDDELIQNYITSYLINIDYFGVENINRTQIQIVLDRVLS